MNIKTGIGLVVALVAWSGCRIAAAPPAEKPSALTSDAFASCEAGDAGQWGCPGEPLAWCRYEVIRRQHATCAADTDCALVDPGDNCMGIGACSPVVVATRYSTAFTQASSAELSQACASATCRDQGSCAPFAYTPRCVEGTCALLTTLPDGGPVSPGLSLPSGCWVGDDDMSCPGGHRAACSLNSSLETYATCTTSSNCVLFAVPDNCLGVGQCVPRSTRVGTETAVLAAIASEVRSFCSGLTCRDTRPCAFSASSPFEAMCAGGRCTSHSVIPDGGP